ncbi:hypothetical protein NQ318_009575 [Aromia moschata]|uniref:Zinc finger C2H2 LYAR-type domain-containing protein n=1 Tax=Aromia moschata TaxID=1265417 RepID=A0AAV8X7X2_9CUCU|nr:hypothetical protein NQ318_009575 [Aromia moschata]
MVVFTCNNCGESLQKPRVEKHYAFMCKTAKSLTCVDCFKDFRGEEYVVHTKCLTEDERYAAKGTYVNGITKKGEVKQESWVEMIKSILESDINMKPSCSGLLNNISNYGNVPRKKNKFMNFIKSSSGGRVNMKDAEEVWNVIENYKQKQAKSDEQTMNKEKTSGQNEEKNIKEEKDNKNEENNKRKRKTSNGDEPDKEENIPTKKKKQKNCEEHILTEETVETETKKFRFQDVILEILMSKKKHFLKETSKKSSEKEVTTKIIKKFNTKLKKVPDLEINDDTFRVGLKLFMVKQSRVYIDIQKKNVINSGYESVRWK